KMHYERQEFAVAVALLEQARPHHQAVLQVNPKDPAYRGCYRTNLRLLADSHLGLADYARAAATADQLAGLGYDPATDVPYAAYILARCLPLAAKDAQLSATDRKTLARTYADRAKQLLGQATQRLVDKPDAQNDVGEAYRFLAGRLKAS